MIKDSHLFRNLIKEPKKIHLQTFQGLNVLIKKGTNVCVK